MSISTNVFCSYQVEGCRRVSNWPAITHIQKRMQHACTTHTHYTTLYKVKVPTNLSLSTKAHHAMVGESGDKFTNELPTD